MKWKNLQQCGKKLISITMIIIIIYTIINPLTYTKVYAARDSSENNIENIDENLYPGYKTLLKSLKEQDKNKIYLFKSGIFYIALGEDAEFLSNAVGFKLTPLNENVKKCGFPISRIEYYKKIFDIGNINYELIQNNPIILNTENLRENKDLNFMINKLQNIDFNNITYKQAYETLEELSNRAKQITLSRME